MYSKVLRKFYLINFSIIFIQSQVSSSERLVGSLKKQREVDVLKLQQKTTKPIKLTELAPVINLNNIEEKNFYFKEAMGHKQRFIYAIINISHYVCILVSVDLSKVTKFEKAGDGIFLAFLLIHSLISLSVFFCYYNMYRNLFLYGANGAMVGMLLTSYIHKTPMNFEGFFYISTIVCSLIMSVLLSIYNRKTYSVSIRDIVKELQDMPDNKLYNHGEARVLV